MTPHRAAFDMYEVIPIHNMHMGDDSIVEAIGMGSILVEVMGKGRTKRIRIKDVLHVPKLHANLLSVSKILSSGCKVQFNMNECIVRAFDGEVIAIPLREGNLYQMTFTKVCEMHVANVAQTSTIDGAFGALASPPRSFEHQRCACAPKDGEWYEPWKHALPYIFICL